MKKDALTPIHAAHAPRQALDAFVLRVRHAVAVQPQRSALVRVELKRLAHTLALTACKCAMRGSIFRNSSLQIAASHSCGSRKGMSTPDTEFVFGSTRGTGAQYKEGVVDPRTSRRRRSRFAFCGCAPRAPAFARSETCAAPAASAFKSKACVDRPLNAFVRKRSTTCFRKSVSWGWRRPVDTLGVAKLGAPSADRPLKARWRIPPRGGASWDDLASLASVGPRRGERERSRAANTFWRAPPSACFAMGATKCEQQSQSAARVLQPCTRAQ